MTNRSRECTRIYICPNCGNIVKAEHHDALRQDHCMICDYPHEGFITRWVTFYGPEPPVPQLDKEAKP